MNDGKSKAIHILKKEDKIEERQDATAIWSSHQQTQRWDIFSSTHYSKIFQQLTDAPNNSPRVSKMAHDDTMKSPTKDNEHRIMEMFSI